MEETCKSRHPDAVYSGFPRSLRQFPVWYLYPILKVLQRCFRIKTIPVQESARSWWLTRADEREQQTLADPNICSILCDDLGSPFQ